MIGGSFWDYFAELRLNPKRIYEYRYEGSVKFGLGLSNTAESGMRLKCNLRIRGSSEQTFVLQVLISRASLCFERLFKNSEPDPRPVVLQLLAPPGLPTVPLRLPLQVSNLTFEEFNGFPGKTNFAASSKLTQHLSAQLATPFIFDYVGGHVSNIRASSEVSDTAVNIVRGILSFFHMTLKTKERIYQLEEASPR